MRIGHFVLLFYLLFMIETSKVEHPGSSYVVGSGCLLSAVFRSAASTPHLGALIGRKGAPFRIATVNMEIHVRSTLPVYTFANRAHLKTFGGQGTGHKKVAWRWTYK